MMHESLDKHFLNRANVEALVKEYGSPLYVYDESVLRDRAREMKNLLDYPWFSVSCSIKANSNLTLLKIIQEEGLNADAVSPGEVNLLLKAGFRPDQILFIGNNISEEEMSFALERDILISVDSLSQLERLGKVQEGSRVSLRFNPGAGAGHHEKVITAGTNTKFGIQNNLIDEAKSIAEKYHLKVVGINQHIGSLFLDKTPYLKGVEALLDIAEQFDELEFVDFGGGFGVPYKRYQGEERLDLKGLSDAIGKMIENWMKKNNKQIKVKIEPGRYIFAECGALLGTVHAVKTSYNTQYIGTDIGFNVIARPVMYDSYHEIAVFRNGLMLTDKAGEATVVGNICETGDILARNRILPEVGEGDVIAILDAGSYGYVMSSNYNQRLRPAEVLINCNGQTKIIRRRDRFEDLLTGYDF